MLDFAALPPEINSGLMYSGPGSGPMLAAAASWDAIAAELLTAAYQCGSVVAELTTDGWLGPASLSMGKAAAPYLAWLHETAARAEQTATQAKAAAAAHDLAFTATVPPPVIAANRALLATLVATNFFGQNTPAIAATEAHYAEMWLQDAVAMYGYAGASAAACRFSPFDSPRPATDPAGPAAQSGALAHAAASVAAAHSTAHSTAVAQATSAMSQLAAVLDPLSTGTITGFSATKVVNTVISTTTSAVSGRRILITNERLAWGGTAAEEENGHLRAPAAAPAPSAAGAASAQLGRAAAVGKLSVPAGWTAAAPEVRPLALASSNTGAGSIPVASAPGPEAPGNMFSQSALGALSRSGADPPRRHKSRPIIVRSPAAG